MSDRLRAIHHGNDATLLRLGDQLLDGIDGPERIADMTDGEDLGPFRERHLRKVPFAAVRDRDHLQHRAMPLTSQLPGHDVAVVLHAAYHHFIALLQQELAKTCRGKVDACRCATGEDDLVRVLRVDMLADGLASGLLCFGGFGAQRVHTTMHVGIDRGVVTAFGLDHAARLLAGGRVVEVHQWLAVHQLLQDRELRTDLLYIVALLRDRFSRGAHSASSFASIKLARCLRQSSFVIRSSTSVMNACESIRRASASLTPRERR